MMIQDIFVKNRFSRAIYQAAVSNLCSESETNSKRIILWDCSLRIVHSRFVNEDTPVWMIVASVDRDVHRAGVYREGNYRQALDMNATVGGLSQF